MSLVFNMVGGGSGGGSGPSASDAILTVTVPTGSTVTAAKGGTTLTPTMWVQAADATLDCALFVIHPAQFDATTPWTVTATLITDSATATVLIDSSKQYDLELSYHYFLYNRGDQFTARTGGWAASRDSATVFQSDHIHLYGGNFPYLYTVNQFLKLNYTKLVVRIENSVFGTGTNSGLAFSYASSQTSVGSSFIRANTDGATAFDISNISATSNYFCGYVYSTGESCDITQIWLE